MRLALLAAASLALQGCATVHVLRDDEATRSETLELSPGGTRIVAREFSVEASTDPASLRLSDRDVLSGPELKVVRFDAWDCEDFWSPLFIPAAPLVLVATPFALLGEALGFADERTFTAPAPGSLAPPLDELGLYLLVGLDPKPCYRIGAAREDRTEKITGRAARATIPGAREKLAVTLRTEGPAPRSWSGLVETNDAGFATLDASPLLGPALARPQAVEIAVGLPGEPAATLRWEPPAGQR